MFLPLKWLQKTLAALALATAIDASAAPETAPAPAPEKAAPIAPAPAQPAPAATAKPAAAGEKERPSPTPGVKFDPTVPGSWSLSARLGKDSAARAELLRDLTGPRQDKSEAPLTRAEAEALLDDPRAQGIYGDKTVAIVAPSMIQKQRSDHVDLLKIFLRPERVQKAVEFVLANREKLERAGKKHSVDPSVVVSILMWESKLGTVTGDFYAFNVFTSQAFFLDEANAVALSGKGPQGDKEKGLVDPARQADRVTTIKLRARNNLLALCRMAKGRSMDALEVKGSWAGALGFPQFMPASLRWAEDGDGDGKVDLFTIDDSIASIANYLDQHNFKADRQKAVWSYNHEDAYVKGVLAFADAVTEQTSGAAKKEAPAGPSPEKAKDEKKP